MTDDPFPPTSRYYGLGTDTLATADGRTVTFVRRRFVPPPAAFQAIASHAVVEGERPDQIAATHFGDPTLSWRLCDANGATDPAELTATPGRRLRVTLPAGIPGAAGSANG